MFPLSKRAARLICDTCYVANLHKGTTTPTLQKNRSYISRLPRGSARSWMLASRCHAVYSCARSASTLQSHATQVPASRLTTSPSYPSYQQGDRRRHSSLAHAAQHVDGALATGRESDQDTIAAIVTSACPLPIFTHTPAATSAIQVILSLSPCACAGVGVGVYWCRHAHRWCQRTGVSEWRWLAWVRYCSCHVRVSCGACCLSDCVLVTHSASPCRDLLEACVHDR